MPEPALPKITANLGLLRQNAAYLVAACEDAGVQLAAVTKGVCADERITATLVEAGLPMLADSRTQNLARLPQNMPRLSLRITDPHEAEQVVQHSEYSLQSGIAAIQALGQAARKQGKLHRIILMVGLGDLREGIHFSERELIQQTAQAVLAEDGLELAGIGTNLTCFGGILPDEDNLGRLMAIAKDLRATLGIPLPIISGGNSSSLHLLFEGRLPAGINHLRVGESLLLGRDTASGLPFSQLSGQVFSLSARLIEVYEKPSMPIGQIGLNAFGEAVSFEDKGSMRRGILAIGRQDTDEQGLVPQDPLVSILGASSDHLLVDLSQSPSYQVGDSLGFTPAYGALLRAYTSAYVAKDYIE